MKFGYDNPYYYEERINLNQLLQNCDQLEIWQKLLGFNVFLHEKFCNPWRVDTNPNCWLYDYNGIIFLADFPSRNHPLGFHGWTIVHAAMHVHNCPFSKAVDILGHEYINLDLSNLPNLTKIQKVSKDVDYQHRIFFKSRNFSTSDAEYWRQFEIGRRNLEDELVYAVKTYWRTRRDSNILMQIKPKDITYAITGKERDIVEIYRPLNKEYKHDSTFKDKDVGGRSKVTDPSLLLITNSYKDYQCVENAGFSSRFVKSESCWLPEDFLRKIEKTFNRVIILTDGDTTGVDAAVRLQLQANQVTNSNKFKGIPFIREKDVKDPADYVRKYSTHQLKQELQNLVA